MENQSFTKASEVRQPVFFIPHGAGPCFFMDWTWGPADTWDKTKACLAGLAATLPAPPKALVVISGHWEEPVLTASSAAHPRLIFDYSGFPEQTYRLTWPAPGNPHLAERVVQRLQNAGLPATTTAYRGYDHGVFIPLKVAFPAAEIPVVTLSLADSLDPGLHIAAGQALAPLRDEGVLIIGSGMSFHNMRGFGQPDSEARSREFDNWLTQAIAAPDAARTALLQNWSSAPSARFAHPREEHLIPLMVAAGAAGGDAGRRIYNDAPLHACISAYRFG